MPPRFRGRGGKTLPARNDNEAGPSRRRSPSAAHEPWRSHVEPGRRSVSLSSSPSYLQSFGPYSENEQQSHGSFIPLQRSNSHHSYGDPTPYFQSRFNPANVFEEPMGYNPVGQEEPFPMDMEVDPVPVQLPTGTPTHPIEISDGSSFHGSPYSGPDSYQARFNQYEWYFTPSYHSQQQPQQQQDPSVDSRFVAVTPPPQPPVEQPPPPPEPSRRRRSTARMSVRRGVHIDTPPHTEGSYYSYHPQEPEMGGPSNPISEVDSVPIPPMGFDNPIPAYSGPAAYNPFEQPAYASRDPYQVAAEYNAQHPEGPYGGPWTTGYPAYGYPQPRPSQPPHHPQPPRMSPPEHQEILQSLREVRHELREERRHNRGMFKNLVSLIKGKSKKDH